METQADIRVFTTSVPDAHFIGPFRYNGELFYIPPNAYSYPSRHKKAMRLCARRVGGLYCDDTDRLHAMGKVYMPINITMAGCIYHKLYTLMEVPNV